jgi:hypothetical protein
MRPLIVLLPLLILIACNPQTQNSNLSSPQSTGGTGSSGGTGGGAKTELQPRLAKVMSYNQYNMTLSKLTGINSSRATTLFDEIKGSLPADTEIDSMTSFNLVAKTRLADFYCGVYVNEFYIKNNITNPPNPTSFQNHLLTTFLDYNLSNPSPIYDSLETELENVLKNSDGQGGKLITSTGISQMDMNKNLSIMACVTILASTHITMIE